MDWFEGITGFAEGSYAETHARLTTEGDQLVNVKTGRRYGMGHLEVIALATLRDRVGPLPTTAAPAYSVRCAAIFANSTWRPNSAAR